MEITGKDGNWIFGTLEIKGNTFSFSAKVFSDPDEGYGITEPTGKGHISKMDVTHVGREDLVLRYDRDWIFNYIPKTSKEVIREIENYIQNEL